MNKVVIITTPSELWNYWRSCWPCGYYQEEEEETWNFSRGCASSQKCNQLCSQKSTREEAHITDSTDPKMGTSKVVILDEHLRAEKIKESARASSFMTSNNNSPDDRVDRMVKPKTAIVKIGSATKTAVTWSDLSIKKKFQKTDPQIVEIWSPLLTNDGNRGRPQRKKDAA